MNEKDWLALKKETEEIFKLVKVDRESTYGFQIQKNTQWLQNTANSC